MSRTRGLLQLTAVGLCLAQLFGCTIEPAANRYSCKNGEACPSGQSCGTDNFCHPTQCTTQADCPSGYECRESMCTKTTGDGGYDNKQDADVDASKDTGPDDPAMCEGNARRCTDNVPEQCVAGAWKQSEPCSGATPTCSNGECTKLTLHGSIVTLTDTSSDVSKVRLSEHGLEYVQPSCGMVQGARVCMSGGIIP